MNPKISGFLNDACNALLRIRHRWVRRVIDKATGLEKENWSRVVMRRSCLQMIEGLRPEQLKVLEISGTYFAGMNFKEYATVQYPEYDVCSPHAAAADEFDLIIAEQVFEHLPWPYRAGKNVYKMLRPNGHFLIATPFLVKIHNIPMDCTRWTETGLKYFLAECGFPIEKIRTSSWGNQACIKANFTEWTRYRRRIHTLRNDLDFPYHVWALAQK